MRGSKDIEFKQSISGGDRARQFMPFMALKGYYDLCREKERHPAPRHELTEEESLELSRAIANLRKGDMVRVTFYDTDAYVTRQGMLSEVVPELGFIRLVREKIAFTDLQDIELVAPAS